VPHILNKRKGLEPVNFPDPVLAVHGTIFAICKKGRIPDQERRYGKILSNQIPEVGITIRMGEGTGSDFLEQKKPSSCARKEICAKGGGKNWC